VTQNQLPAGELPNLGHVLLGGGGRNTQVPDGARLVREAQLCEGDGIGRTRHGHLASCVVEDGDRLHSRLGGRAAGERAQ
jgi:hypothetical protein